MSLIGEYSPKIRDHSGTELARRHQTRRDPSKEAYPTGGCKLQVAGCRCRLQVAGCRLQVQVAGCRLQVAGCRCRLQVAGCRLQVAGCRCRLQVAGCRLQVQVAGCRLQVAIIFFSNRRCMIFIWYVST